MIPTKLYHHVNEKFSSEISLGFSLVAKRTAGCYHPPRRPQVVVPKPAHLGRCPFLPLPCTREPFKYEQQSAFHICICRPDVKHWRANSCRDPSHMADQLFVLSSKLTDPLHILKNENNPLLIDISHGTYLLVLAQSHSGTFNRHLY